MAEKTNTVPNGMHESFVDSMGVENLFKYAEFNTAADLDMVAGETGACVRLANLYMRQKGVLVSGRDDLQTALEAITGFKQLTTTEKKVVDGEETVITVPAEKPAEWWSRFKKAALTNTLKQTSGVAYVSGEDNEVLATAKTEKDRKITGKIDGTSEAAFEDSIRAISYQLGPYLCDPRKAVREAKEKKLAQTWLDAAKQIIAKGPARVAFWKGVFTKGDVNVPTPTAFEPFDTPVPAKATPEEAATITEKNILNLGTAIKAYDNKLRQGRYC